MLTWTKMNGFPTMFYYNAKKKAVTAYEGVFDDAGMNLLEWIYQQNEELRENCQDQMPLLPTTSSTSVFDDDDDDDDDCCDECEL